MKDLNITGGSGYVASTLQRPRLWVAKWSYWLRRTRRKIIKRKRSKRVKGGAILGIADSETEPRGDITISSSYRENGS
jgi:hypothetical protein